MVAGGVGEPTALLRKVIDTAPSGVEIFVGLSHSQVLSEPGEAPLLSFGALGPLNRPPNRGRVGILPYPYDDLPRALINRGGDRVVLLMQVAPADRHGRHSLGFAVDYCYELVDRARLVLVEVNDALPSTDTPTLSAADLEVAERSCRPLPMVAGAVVTPIHERIAALIADRIPERATLQLGLGSVPSALGRALAGLRDLKVRSTLAGDWLHDLRRAGCLADDEDSVVISEAAGSEALYAMVAGESVRLRPVSEVVGPMARGEIERLVAVNSALEVDLTGQINAEQIGSVYRGAIAGHPEFMRAAGRSPGGLAVVALGATAGGGSISRIVDALEPQAVTTPRSSVDLVVTEYGLADLRGRTLSERRELMISIAAPQFRAALRQKGRQ
ncbi:Acetyl-CoA transferase/ hydrolase, probable acetate CoA-transferase [Gordonia sp. KTR9]|nr:Acetyl-CoA transferase/ hydrolase, probable acetate CoA-transferase [Gordonia sp. KTR9]